MSAVADANSLTGDEPLRLPLPARQGRRILLVTPQPFYDDRGTPIAVEHTAKALCELGHRVDLLAFPFGSGRNIPGMKILRSDNWIGVSSVPIGFSWQKCILDASLMRSFERLLKSGRYDAVHAVEEAAYMAASLCRRAHTPFVYDMASSIPAELARKPLLGSRPAQLFLGSVEKTVIKSAAHVLCSMGLADHVKRRSPGTSVTEWRYPSTLAAADPHIAADIREKLQIQPFDKVVVYAGNFARYQGMDLLFQAFERAHALDPDLLLVCVGAAETERQNWLANLSPAIASRVRIVTRKPRLLIPAYLSLANCLVSLRPISRNLPLKIFEYMTTAIPIVATRGPAHEPLLNSQRAYLRDPTAESVADGIVEAVQSPEKSAQLGQRAQTYAKNQFGWSGFVDFVGSVYESVLDDSHEPALVGV